VAARLLGGDYAVVGFPVHAQQLGHFLFEEGGGGVLVAIGGFWVIAWLTIALVSGIEGGDAGLGDSGRFAQKSFDELMDCDQGLVARVAELADGDVKVAIGVEAPITNCVVALLCLGHDDHRDLHRRLCGMARRGGAEHGAVEPAIEPGHWFDYDIVTKVLATVLAFKTDNIGLNPGLAAASSGGRRVSRRARR